MSRLVIDAAVGLKWVIAEAASEQASALSGHDLLAPDSIILDWAEALRAKELRGEITPEERSDRLGVLARAPLSLTPAAALIEPASDLASRLGLSVRCALYATLADRARCPLITADPTLVARLEAGDWGGTALLLGQPLATRATG
ncbi:MAG: type II toxin-antitoxin system VapC family toxin [Thermoanaerobaculia bacterium]|nr:type II toxin-antitoxin system VapC family toxin [Thermoanaerobaculia bacterium]